MLAITHCVFASLATRAAFLSRRSPSANHLLAFTSCNTLMYCFIAMTGELATVRTHGTMLSILFARAISIAAALNGLGKSRDGAG